MSYQFCSGGSYCFSSNTTSVTASTIGCISKLDNPQYSISGSRIYNTNFVSESIYATLLSDIGFSGIENNLTSPATQWGSIGNSILGPMNKQAVWFDSDCNGQVEIISGDLTISHYFYNSGTTNQYYLGFGAYIIPNGKINLTINNNIILSGDASVIGSSAQLYHKFWHIIPITLLSCDNYIDLTITSSGVFQNAVGMVIYNNSYSEIINATDDNDLDIIFETKSLLTINNKTGPFVKAGCPSGYMLSANTVTATCISTIYTACTCTCCDRYSVARIFGDENFVYNDCNNQPKVITNLNIGDSIQVCACSIITPKVQLTNNIWSAGNGQFRVILINSCDSTCISIPDGPPPTPIPESVCSDCGFTTFSIGETHTVGISGDTLFAWGSNSYGQLGLGFNGGTYYTPQLMIDPTGGVFPWVYVEAGLGCTFAINSNGDLYACGVANSINGGDQLGLNNISPTTYNTLTQITSPNTNGWSKIWSKYTTTIALRTDGTIWGTGFNEFYQLGLGNNIDQTQFTQIGTDNDWVEIARGIYHTIGLKNNGTIYSWGTNFTFTYQTNPLGLGSTSNNQEAQIPTQIITPNYPLYSNNILYNQISAGNYHSVALSTDSSIWGWGQNISGQIDCLNCGALDFSKPFPMDGGISVDPPNVNSQGSTTNLNYIFVKASGDITLAITSDITLNFIPFTSTNGINWTPNLTGDRIWVWGNSYGSNLKTLLQDEANRVELTLKNDWCYVWIGGPANQDILSGGNNLVFFAKDVIGNIFTWGTNQYGQLGIGQTLVCSLCNNNYVEPIGLCFNSPESECPCPECNCVIYTLTNNSTSEISFTYVDCSNNLQTSTLASGGFGSQAITILLCACFNTITINGVFNPNLVIITTNQNPCT